MTTKRDELIEACLTAIEGDAKGNAMLITVNTVLAAVLAEMDVEVPGRFRYLGCAKTSPTMRPRTLAEARKAIEELMG